MYRQIVTPESTRLILQIPEEFVGHRVEVIAFTTEPFAGKKYSLEENREFYKRFSFDHAQIKFNRDELNER